MNLHDVFTPSTIAKATFVERNYLNEQLISALKTPGKQIILYGQSGSGKSTLIQNKYKEVYKKSIVSKCNKKSTFKYLIHDAFSQFEVFFHKEILENTTRKVTAETNISAFINAKLRGETGSGKTMKRERIGQYQYNESNLSGLLNESNACWIIEDFHKVAPQEKDHFADSLKIFTDSTSKVILIGAVFSATEILEYNPEMENRIAEINVPLMERTDLAEIIKKGSKKLNIEFEENLINGIIDLSTRKGAVCHQLCLDICNASKIDETQNVEINIPYSALKKAIDAKLFAKSGAFRTKYDKMVSGELSEKVLITFLKLGKDISYHNQITTLLNQENPTYSMEEVKQMLNELTTNGVIDLYTTRKGAACYQLCSVGTIDETQNVETNITYSALKRTIDVKLFAKSGDLLERVLIIFLKLRKGISHNQITTLLNQENPTYSIEEVKQMLDELTTQELGKVLKIDHFGGYSFENLFYLAYCAERLIKQVDSTSNFKEGKDVKIEEGDINIPDYTIQPSSCCKTILDLIRMKNE